MPTLAKHLNQSKRMDIVTLAAHLRAAARGYERAAADLRAVYKDQTLHEGTARMLRENDEQATRCAEFADALDDLSSWHIDGDLLIVKTS